MRSAKAMAMIAWISGACAPYLNVPTAMHPSPTANERSVGVAGGIAYANPEDTDTNELLVVPHAEGWIHLPVAQNAQVGVHLGPNIGHLALRFDLVPLAGGVGLALQPFFGGGYGKATESEETNSENLITLAGGLNLMVLVPAGAGHAYVIPKIGYGWIKQYDDSDMTDEEGNNIYTLGLTAGIDLGTGTSLEITVHRLDDAEDVEPDASPVWLVVPTIGVRH